MSFKDIFKLSLPVLFGYVPLGAAYALLAISIGLPVWAIILASLVVYAGSGQFLLVSLLSVGAGVLEIFVATFVLNLRHIFYTTTLLDDIVKAKSKFYTIFALTDESFAVLKTAKVSDENRDKLYFYLPLLNQIYWVIGSILGVLVGSNLDLDYRGIEFCLVGLFVVLAVEILRGDRNFKLLGISLGVGIFGLLFLPAKSMLILSLVIGFILILILRKWL